ncbi:hypothetical protein NLI96_g11491 [Meripilus lineatus]|uniref:U1-type domain-containing protein n=1 Tax=Meripilus lineatus TaxID=2056292 RepID=A0AAD5Y8E2_9APHY|nr:hypothetical protein NLI96_g11491 [Physisporinus lineatus]
MGKKTKEGAVIPSIDDWRDCDVCSRPIQVGTGGDSNWANHIDSKGHKQNLKKLCDKSNSKSLTAFFKPVPRPDYSVPSPVSTSESYTKERPENQARKLIVPSKNPTALTTLSLASERLGDAGSHTQISISADPTLLSRLRQLSATLPSHIPYGMASDPLGRLVSFDLSAGIAEGDDPYETVDPILNQTTQNITSTLYYLSLGSRSSFVRFNYDPSRESSPEIVLIEGPMANPSRLNDPPVRTSRSVLCPGFPLSLPSSISPFGAYPYLRHDVQNLPWKCASLEDHPALKSIQESIHFGAHKNTPLVYLSPHELVESVRRKTSENPSGLYQPRDYLEEEFHRILLFSKLGGGRVASIAQRSCFLPSACTAERKLKVQPLQSSPSYLTQQELHLNLSVVLPLPEFSTYAPEVPVVVCVDELKLEERL